MTKCILSIYTNCLSKKTFIKAKNKTFIIAVEPITKSYKNRKKPKKEEKTK